MNMSHPLPINRNQAEAGIDRVPFDEAQSINAEPHDQAVRAVTAWRPEDAAHFLTQTIRESQRPLSEALAQRGVPTNVVLLGLFTMMIFASGLMYLISRLDRSQSLSGDSFAPGLAAVVEAQQQRKAEEEAARLRSTEAVIEKLEERIVVLSGERDKAVADMESARKKVDETAEAGARRITELADQLQGENVLGARLATAESLYRKTVEAQASQRKTGALLQRQLTAQAEEVESLRQQLTAARELIRVLQGEEGEEEAKTELVPLVKEALAGGALKEAVIPPVEGTEEAKEAVVEE